MIDVSEPEVVQQMRRELRLQHKVLRTERSYIGWIFRYIRHCQADNLKQFGEPQIKEFLTDLAVDGSVTAGAQEQARSALLFLYQQVFGREITFLNVTRPNKAERLPVVLSRPEIGGLVPEFTACDI